MAKVDVENKAKNGFSSDEYNDVAMSAQLDAINLLSSNFKVSPENMNAEGELKLFYDAKVVSCMHNPEEEFVAAIFQYEVEGKRGRKKTFKCVADYAVLYSVSHDAKHEAAIGFCKNVGRFAAYPYFRSHVAQTAWSAGLTLPPLPSIASTAHIPKAKVISERAKAKTNDEM